MELAPGIPNPTPPGERRGHIIQELLDTESSYIGSLDALLEFQQTLAARDVPPSNAVTSFFSTFQPIWDFHQRWRADLQELRAVAVGEDMLRHVVALLERHEGGFQAYDSYFKSLCTLQRNRVIEQVEDDIRVPASENQLANVPIKSAILHPYSRFAKYSVLFKDFGSTGSSPTERALWLPAQEAVDRIQAHSWDVLEAAQCQEAMLRLPARVISWKGHQLSQLGALLRYGEFEVDAGRGRGPKRYEVYLFKKAIFCFRPRQTEPRARSNYICETLSDNDLALKGRVYAWNIKRIVPEKLGVISAGSFPLRQGYSLCIHWTADSGGSDEEQFTIHFPTVRRQQQWMHSMQELELANGITMFDVMIDREQAEFDVQERDTVNINIGGI